MVIDGIAHSSTPLSKLRFAGESSALAISTRTSRSSRASLPFVYSGAASGDINHGVVAGQQKRLELALAFVDDPCRRHVKLRWRAGARFYALD